ncbi:MAG: ketoacyl reductase [Pirellula sp.]|nr:ketoacyl reductase [Pirellula sp.]
MNRSLRKLAGVACAAAGSWYVARTLLRRQRDFSYAGKTVLVTGGARGLGLVLARNLVAEGARVVICARTGEQLIDAAKELALRGGEVMAFACDVRDQDAVEQMVAEVTASWGPIDVLINVAGIIEVGPLDSMTVDDFRRSMDTHCFGPLHTTLAVLPGMRSRGWGRIVNIASLGGKRAVPHMTPYAASKFALVGLSSGLRAELAQENILVTTVCPGLLRTGSPRNAGFKGRHRDEYAWFSIGDSLPLLSMNADRAAKQILKACRHGDAEIVLSGMGSFAAALQSLAPNFTAELASLANRLLPPMGGIGRASARGHESHSRWSPSVLTTLGDEAAERNNEY